VFVGAVSASIAIVEETGANTDTLDFSALSLGDDTGVSVDLARTAYQSVTATLTVTRSVAPGSEYVTGPEVINEESRAAMRNALKRIQTGEYAKMFILEGRTGYPSMTARRRLTADHSIEKVGSQLRAMMPWIAKNKLVDQSRN
jgi:hypothetical protein